MHHFLSHHLIFSREIFFPVDSLFFAILSILHCPSFIHYEMCTSFLLTLSCFYPTVCRKCIYKKLNDEELEHCPVCKIDLGCAPLEKLRADHNIQDVRSKIFPLKRKKINTEGIESPIVLPAKRKERSISSLVVNTPEITPKSLTGRRTRAATRKSAAALRDLGPIIPPVKKDSDNSNKNADNSSLLDSLSKVPQTRRQLLSNAETSSHPSNKDKGGDNKDFDKSELWRPLNCLVEAASKTKSFRSSPAARGNQPNESASSANASRTKAKEYLLKPKVQDEKKEIPVTTVPFKRKGPGRGRKPAQPPATAVPSSAVSKNDKLSTPVWFSLIASFDQKGAPPLPQIPTHYLRIKDDNMPASSIQKYIMQKLSLPSETEVEISCCGQPVNPIQPLRNLIERWLRFGPARPLQTVVGSAGGDYVMVISYGRPKSA
uniref:RING-type domain-containing protein n=1 Tax=Oryza brachyantha TaxID=4533 RepID=J3NEQ8_ORYBR